MQDFLIVQAAVMPTRVLPAPHGRTMIPDRARLPSSAMADEGKGSEGENVPVSKHLAETLFLIRTNGGRRFEINLERRIELIMSKVILLHHRIIQVQASPLDILQFHLFNLKGMNFIIILNIVLLLQSNHSGEQRQISRLHSFSLLVRFRHFHLGSARLLGTRDDESSAFRRLVLLKTVRRRCSASRCAISVPVDPLGRHASFGNDFVAEEDAERLGMTALDVVLVLLEH